MWYLIFIDLVAVKYYSELLSLLIIMRVISENRFVGQLL